MRGKKPGGMLALGRRIGESIRIGDHIRIQIIGISGGQVHIGIDAPRDIPVVREELYAPQPETRR